MPGHVPLNKQVSSWRRLVPALELPGVVLSQWMRPVSDGTLIAIAGDEPDGWHLSISFRNTKGEHTRYPNWDEMVHAVRFLMPHALTYVMILPPDDEHYVNAHPTTMHWHELNAYTHEEYPRRR